MCARAWVHVYMCVRLQKNSSDFNSDGMEGVDRYAGLKSDCVQHLLQKSNVFIS